MKKVYAKATVPVKTISGTDGVIASSGTSQTAYHGKTFGPSTMTPVTRGTARTARWAAPPRHATAITQAAVAASASIGSFTNERTRPGLKYSSRTKRPIGANGQGSGLPGRRTPAATTLVNTATTDARRRRGSSRYSTAG